MNATELMIVESLPSLYPFQDFEEDALQSLLLATRWTPVTERLPEDDTVVLVCGRKGGVYSAIHNNSRSWWRGWWKLNSKNHHCEPIAWMPLPEPYREEEK